MSPAAPEATNRASTTPRRDGVARFAGRGGEVATATGRTPRIDADPKEASRWRPDPARGRPQPPGPSGARNRSGPGGVTTTRHRYGRVSMRLGRAAVGVALVAMVIVAGCSADRDSGGGGGSAGGGGPGAAAGHPAAPRDGQPAPGPPAGQGG